MKYHLTDDKDIRDAVLEGLKINKGYCPCVINSQGDKNYKCPCKEFREEIEIGNYCYCGLFHKDEY